jgi:hypothetical protein
MTGGGILARRGGDVAAAPPGVAAARVAAWSRTHPVARRTPPAPHRRSPWRRRSLAAVAAAGVAAVLLVAAPDAGAARYVVVGCADPATLLTFAHTVRATDGWVNAGVTPPGGDTCGQGRSGHGLYAVSALVFQGYRFDAPPGTALTDAWLWFTAHLPAGAPWAVPVFAVEARYDDLWSYVAPAAGWIGARPIDFGATWVHSDLAGAGSLRIGVRCELGPCSAEDIPHAEIRSIGVALDDPEPPSLEPPAGPLLNGDPQQGVRELSVAASDRGGGVARLQVTGGAGQILDDWHGDGDCVPLAPWFAALPHYDARVPCPPRAQRSVPIDTTRLSDGSQTLTVRAEDAAGNARSVAIRVLVDNLPPAPGAVAVTGDARSGERLSAEATGFAGQDPQLVFRWQRCSAAGDTCVDAAGTQRTYRLGAADVGDRIRARVIASDHGGSTTAFSALTTVVAAAPGEPTATATPNPSPTPAPLSPAATPFAAPAPPPAPVAPPPAPVAPAPALMPDHVANGTHADERAVVLAWLELGHGRRGRTLGAPAGVRVRIRGRLTDESGRPIAGAALSLIERIHGWPYPASGVTTRHDGRFTAFTRLGPSRTLRFSYRAFSDSHHARESPLLRLTVRR